MKRKLTSGIFVLAAGLTVTSAFYSCKDYDDERIDAIQSEHATHVLTWNQDIDEKVKDAFDKGTYLSDNEGKSAAWKSFIESYITSTFLDPLTGTYLKDNGYKKASDIYSDPDFKSAVEGTFSGTSFTDAVKKYMTDNNIEAFNIADYFTLDEDGKPEIISQLGSVEAVVDSIITAGKAKDLRIDSLAKENMLVNLRVDSVAGKVKDVENSIVELDNKIEKLYELIKAQVTSVVVQGASNPVVGTFSLPIGIQSNILAGYYGTVTATGGKGFPAIAGSNGVYDTDVFTSADAAVIDFDNVEGKISLSTGDALVSSNAGTVYVTVNPNTVDFEGKVLELVNSQDEAAGLTLGALKKSDKTLSFGVSRAADNGFYEAEAQIDLDNLSKATLDINKDGLKEVARDILSYSDGIDFTNAAMQLYNAVSDLGDAYALKATYSDTLGDHSVYSDYKIGAYAIKPLSYNFLKDSKYNNLGRIKTLPEQLTLESLGLGDFKIESVSFGSISDEDLKDISAKFYIDASAVDENGNVTVPNAEELDIQLTYVYDLHNSDNDNTIRVYKQDGKFYSTYNETTKECSGYLGEQDKYDYTLLELVRVDSNIVWGESTVLFSDLKSEVVDGATKYYIEQNVSLEAIRNSLKDYTDNVDTQLSDMIEDINNKIQSIGDNKVFDAYNKYVSKVNSLINKVNGALSDINAKLQPVLVADINGSYTLVSNTKAIGNPVSFSEGAGLPLYLTSYTAEILAPAYKKFIAVTNAWDNETNEQNIAKAKAANSSSDNFNKVIDGNEYRASFSGEAGYTYEIAYACLDYSGVQSVKRFYITVNK